MPKIYINQLIVVYLVTVLSHFVSMSMSRRYGYVPLPFIIASELGLKIHY